MPHTGGGAVGAAEAANIDSALSRAKNAKGLFCLAILAPLRETKFNNTRSLYTPTRPRAQKSSTTPQKTTRPNQLLCKNALKQAAGSRSRIIHCS